MKLPFSNVLGPILKPYLGSARVFCHNPLFSMSHFYTNLYGILGFIISANHLRRHLGEPVPAQVYAFDGPSPRSMRHPDMVLHDLKIIATAMGLVQYACVILGCITKNPALFLPHLFGQLVIVTVKVINALLLLVPVNIKGARKLLYKVPAIMLMSFNWLQEFCVFRRCLSVCDF